MIDLFAGIGGIRLGFERAFGVDAETVFVSEIDPYARKTYAANFHDDAPIAGDITEFPTEKIPDFDICLAGFPCQAFSIAGRRAGFADDYHGVCRGTLFNEVVRICEHHQPKVIFCENVKGLVNHDGGRTFKIICAAFEQIGYKIFHAVLNSRNFGLAQNRERIYIVCFRKDIAPERFDFPTPTDEKFFIRDILEHAPIDTRYYLSDRYLETLRRHKARHAAAGNGFGYEIKSLDDVANALVCGGMGRERNLIVDAREHSTVPTTRIHGAINSENVRKLTPREWARLQGFGDDFILPISDTWLYKQFGNSVSIDVIAAIAHEIKEVLDPMRGNKGDWSELYALLKILADGVIQVDTQNENYRLPVVKVFREDNAGFKLEFRREKNFVELYKNGGRVKKFSIGELATMAEKIFSGIKNYHDDKRAFEIPAAQEIMSRLELTKIKSPANKKTDIELTIHDAFTGFDATRCYSIKSDLGNAPTLLNASKLSTRFKFRIPDENNLEQLEFVSVVKDIFRANLSLIDSNMGRILGEMLKLYHCERVNDCAELATRLEEDDPLKFGVKDFYRHKIKKFLCAVALGLRPATKWNGIDEANGGYIIVKKNGEIATYPLHDRDEFENYLLNNTRLDTPSTRRHKYAEVYRGGGNYFIDLNLQIRFK